MVFVGQDHDPIDGDTTVDRADTSVHLSTQDVEDETKEVPDRKKDAGADTAVNDCSDMNASVNEEKKPVSEPEDPTLQNQENNDATEDFINLNLEEEEEFGEVSCIYFNATITEDLLVFLLFCRKSIIPRIKVRTFFHFISFG